MRNVKYGDKVDKTKMILLSSNLYDDDGVIIELSKECCENIAMDIVNRYEQLENTSNKGYDKIKNIKKSMSIFKMAIDERCGSFYFDFYKRFKNIERQFIFRFLYVCTYMNYDNKLSNGKRLLYEKDLKDILNLGKSEFFKTKKVFIDNNLMNIDENGNIKINEWYCKKGDININKNIEVVRMFNNAIQELYEKALPKEHKKLGLLIAILPYINLKYNIVCHNVKEESLENIKPMTIKELCTIVDYDVKNSSRLKSDLLRLTVNKENVVMFNEKYGSKIMTINPKVYYKGTNIEALDYLIGLFSIE